MENIERVDRSSGKPIVFVSTVVVSTKIQLFKAILSSQHDVYWYVAIFT